MGESDNLALTVVIYANSAEREFQNLENTFYKQAFNNLKKENNLVVDSLAKIFGKIHDVSTDPIRKALNDIFTSDEKEIFGKQQLPWYLREFIVSLDKKLKAGSNYSNYSITIKACKEHYFYSFKGQKKDEEWEMLHVPYFFKATPEEKVKRGFADTILFLAPRLNAILKEYLSHPQNSKSKRALESSFTKFIEWFNIDLNWKTCKYDESNRIIIFEATPQINILKFISLPPENKPILVVSKTFRDAVEKLSECWLNPTTKSILLSAGTGTGKEVLVGLLTDAMSINNKKNRIDISAPSIKRFEDLNDKIQNFFKEKVNNQKITKASLDNRVILFLDEIHHDASRELRSVLLRIMESDELETGIGKTLGGKIRDHPRIIYVFAASLPTEKLYTTPPIDLWTRIDYTIKILHPLRTNDENERKEILSAYFLLFWGIFIKKFKESKNPELADSTRNFLDNLENNDKLALKFATELCSPLIPLISIRTLRSIIKRLLGKTVNLICQNPRCDKERLYKKIEENFKKWIVDIFNEMVPENSGGLF